MKNATLKLCVTLILALTVAITTGPTACYAEEQTTVAVEESSKVSTEITVETNDEEYIDMWSIPEELRTEENFGPAFVNGVPKTKAPLTINETPITEDSSVEETITIEPLVVEEAPLQTSPVIEVGKAKELVQATSVVEVEQPIEEEEVVRATPVLQNRWNITLTEGEKRVLAQIVYLESGNQSDLGQQAVVEVIFNRMYSGRWPNDCVGVLSQVSGGYRQFSTWKIRNKAKVSAREYANIEAVLNGQTSIFPYKTVYFSRKGENKRVERVIGDHVFCNE